MLYINQYDVNTWISGAYDKYYNSAFSCDSFSRIKFSTPISGTLNVTITNNTENSISNMYDVPLTLTQRPNTYFTTTSGTTKYYFISTDNSYKTFWYNNNTNNAVTYKVKALVSAYFTAAQWISGNTPDAGGTTISNKILISQSSPGTITIPAKTSTVTKQIVVGYQSKGTGFSPNMVEVSMPEYNLQLDAIDSNNNSTRINVDLGQTTLAPNASVTIPITFPNDTVRLSTYVGGVPLTDFPQTSIPYTGWAKNQERDKIHESYDNHWM